MRLASFSALLLVAAGCGDDVECVIDSDCELFQICEAQVCVPRGGVRDGGGEGGRPDAGDAGGIDGAVDGGPVVTRTGGVTASQTPTGDPGTTPHLVIASFTETTMPSDACTVTTMDACTLSNCFFPAPPADAGMPIDAGMPTSPSAGMIVVNGDPTDVVLTASSDGTYPPASGTGQLWSGESTVTVTAAGMEVPAFTAMLTGPTQSAVGSPSFMTPPVTIDRAGDFTFTWSGGSGTVEGRLANTVTTTEGTRSVSVTCTYDSASGTGTMPAAMLEEIPTGDAATFAVTNVAEQAPDVAGWEVTVRLTTPATLDTGATSAVVTLTDSTP